LSLVTGLPLPALPPVPPGWIPSMILASSISLRIPAAALVVLGTYTAIPYAHALSSSNHVRREAGKPHGKPEIGPTRERPTSRKGLKGQAL
jgi:hypothetical protein